MTLNLPSTMSTPLALNHTATAGSWLSSWSRVHPHRPGFICHMLFPPLACLHSRGKAGQASHEAGITTISAQGLGSVDLNGIPGCTCGVPPHCHFVVSFAFSPTE